MTSNFSIDEFRDFVSTDPKAAMKLRDKNTIAALANGVAHFLRPCFSRSVAGSNDTDATK